MRIIARKTLREFWQKNRFSDSEQSLKSWFNIASDADWSNPSEVKSQLGHVSVIGDNRLVFNIAGNKYRLIAKVNYDYRIIYIRFIGAHKQYDSIKAEEIFDMNITPIRSEQDYSQALREIEGLMDAQFGTAKGDRLDVLTTLVEAYEAKHYPIDAPDPVAAIHFVMEQRGLKRKDLEPYIGGRSRVAEVLNSKRSLTLAMIRKLNQALGIPAEVLIRKSQLA